MKLPVIRGVIRRRLLINFRADPAVIRAVLPAPFRPKLHKGYAIAGICLIRLEKIWPRWLPGFLGHSSENAAHRIAVEWDEPDGTRKGVFIPRRDTGSLLNHWTGGRLFPGEHSLADFRVSETGPRISMDVKSPDGRMRAVIKAVEDESLPGTSCFSSIEESSAFFAAGKTGYSVTRDCCRLDGIRLETGHWKVKPLTVESVVSSYFEDSAVFPPGSIVLDHALIMRDLEHEWYGEPEMQTAKAGTVGISD